MPQKQFLQIWSKIQPALLHPRISIKLCHVYATKSKKKRSCKSSYEFNVTKTYRSISNNFVSYPPANPISYLHKNCLRANQILNGCQIWSTAVYNSLMVRTYIFETRIPISPWRRSLSLSLFTDLFTNATVNRAMRYVWPFPALRETYIYLDGPLNDGNYGI